MSGVSCYIQSSSIIILKAEILWMSAYTESTSHNLIQPNIEETTMSRVLLKQLPKQQELTTHSSIEDWMQLQQVQANIC